MTEQELIDFLIEQKQLKIKKNRAKFRAKLKYPAMDDKLFEKAWKKVITE
jgi:hypothetical protein